LLLLLSLLLLLAFIANQSPIAFFKTNNPFKAVFVYVEPGLLPGIGRPSEQVSKPTRRPANTRQQPWLNINKNCFEWIICFKKSNWALVGNESKEKQ
jgi:hypothetical protein